jgi:hypothetical protein
MVLSGSVVFSSEETARAIRFRSVASRIHLRIAEGGVADLPDPMSPMSLFQNRLLRTSCSEPVDPNRLIRTS